MNELQITKPSLPIIGPKESLPRLIDRASSKLAHARTYGEILEAKEAARLAYNAAKAEARIRKAKQAHDQIQHDLTSLKADALAIQVRAEIRLAEEVDAAQERGELAKNGQRGAKKAVLKENGFSRATSSEIGTLRREIHEARQLRDAEAADPGVVERALDDIVTRGEEPTRAALKREITQKPTPRRVMNPRALWLWGRLKDFERDGVLAEDITDLLKEMTEPMRDDVRRLLPKVNAFLTEMEKSAGTTYVVKVPEEAEAPAQRYIAAAEVYIEAANAFGNKASECSHAELLEVNEGVERVEWALNRVRSTLKELEERVKAARREKRATAQAAKEAADAAKAAERAAAKALKDAQATTRAKKATANKQGEAA